MEKETALNGNCLGIVVLYILRTVKLVNPAYSDSHTHTETHTHLEPNICAVERLRAYSQGWTRVENTIFQMEEDSSLNSRPFYARTDTHTLFIIYIRGRRGRERQRWRFTALQTCPKAAQKPLLTSQRQSLSPQRFAW